MSEVSVPADRFWRDYNPDLALSLPLEQRAEIDRVLGAHTPPRPSTVGDLRISCYFFFVRILWGREKRSSERIKREQVLYPTMTRRNAPMLASIFAGYIAIWYMVLIVAAVFMATFLRG
jgi:hypothetical protein